MKEGRMKGTAKDVRFYDIVESGAVLISMAYTFVFV
jgi:hypothetical protein